MITISPALSLVALLGGLLAGILLWSGNHLLKTAVSVEQVVPFTEQNAQLLPVQETLLRGSDLPSEAAQAELLRATQAGQETPHVELLRSSAEESSVSLFLYFGL